MPKAKFESELKLTSSSVPARAMPKLLQNVKLNVSFDTSPESLYCQASSLAHLQDRFTLKIPSHTRLSPCRNSSQSKPINITLYSSNTLTDLNPASGKPAPANPTPPPARLRIAPAPRRPPSKHLPPNHLAKTVR